jgi:hypothetical protein
METYIWTLLNDNPILSKLDQFAENTVSTHCCNKSQICSFIIILKPGKNVLVFQGKQDQKSDELIFKLS